MKCKCCGGENATDLYDFCLTCIEKNCDIDDLLPLKEFGYDPDKKEEIKVTPKKKKGIVEFIANGDIVVFIVQIVILLVTLILPVGLLIIDSSWDRVSISNLFWFIIPAIYIAFLIAISIIKNKKTSIQPLEKPSVQPYIALRAGYLEDAIDFYLECKARNVNSVNDPDFDIIVKNMNDEIEDPKRLFSIGKKIDAKIRNINKEFELERELKPYYDAKLEHLSMLLGSGKMTDKDGAKKYIDKIKVEPVKMKKLEFGSEEARFNIKAPEVKMFKKPANMYCKIKINMFEEGILLGEGYITNRLYDSMEYDVVFKMDKKIKDKKSVTFEYEFLESIISE